MENNYRAVCEDGGSCDVIANEWKEEGGDYIQFQDPPIKIPDGSKGKCLRAGTGDCYELCTGKVVFEWQDPVYVIIAALWNRKLRGPRKYR
jgi:hypothetical protein